MSFRHSRLIVPFFCLLLTRVANAAPSVVINEIMYAPVAPEPEWIEIYNPDSNAVDLSRWQCSNNTKSITFPPYTLSANSYLVITKDSAALRAKRPGNYPIVQVSLFALTNTGGYIILRDSANNTIDSLYYSPSWGGKNGTSLQRKSVTDSSTQASNWFSSEADSGATPGEPNSVITSVAALPLAMVVNEIMFAPISPEPEWIELLNTSSDTIDLSGWQIGIAHYSAKTIPSGTALVPPDSMIILTSNDSVLALLRQVPRSRIIPVALSALSNSGSTVTLRDPSNNLIDSVSYDGTWIHTDGISIERIDPTQPGWLASNWEACQDTSGCTILMPNSVRVLSHDLALIGYTITDSSIIVTLLNNGTDTILNTAIVLQTGLDSIVKTVTGVLQHYDSMQVVFAIPNDFFGVLNCFAAIRDSLDGRPANDSLHFALYMPIPPDSLVINEIMFDPQPGNCEWLEIYNISTRWVAMMESVVATGQKRIVYYEHLPQFIIPPSSFGLFSANSLVLTTYPSLIAQQQEIMDFNRTSIGFANDSCSVTLYNGDFSKIDSVRYYESWQISTRPNLAGVSLERKRWNAESNDPHNWQACTDSAGATPLSPNSATHNTSSPNNTTFAASFDPNPFSPDGDGFQDESTLTVASGDNTIYAMRVRMFDLRGRAVRTLADAVPMTASATLTLDGRNDKGQLLPLGLYTVLVELSSQNPPRLMKKVIGVAVAGRRR
jgi:hypothetical protein